MVAVHVATDVLVVRVGMARRRRRRRRRVLGEVVRSHLLHKVAHLLRGGDGGKVIRGAERRGVAGGRQREADGEHANHLCDSPRGSMQPSLRFAMGVGVVVGYGALAKGLWRALKEGQG